MATAAKKTPAKAAPAAKAAPKAVVQAAPPPPAPEPEVAAEVPEGEEIPLEAGATIVFLGYAEDTPQEERYLTDGTEYLVTDLTDEGNAVVALPNPDFNGKKKEHPETNPSTLEVEVYAAECEVIAGPEEVAPEPEPEPVVEPSAPAPAPAAKTAKPAAEPAVKATPAPAAPAAKTAPAAKKTVVKAIVKTAEPEVDPDDLPDLENEDAEVLALVEGAEDLIGTAQSLEYNVATSEYQLGGVLYHIRKSKVFRAATGADGKPVAAYSEKGGWAMFLSDFLNIDYRKAMNLIEIYQYFTQAGIENAAEKVAAMGWTKASKIAKYLVGEGANTAELIELAETNSVADLTTTLKEQIAVGGSVKVQRVTLKFRFLAEEGNAIDTALEKAREQLGLRDKGEALAAIITDWATTNGGGTATVKAAPKQGVAVKAGGAKPIPKRSSAAVAAAA